MCLTYYLLIILVCPRVSLGFILFLFLFSGLSFPERKDLKKVNTCLISYRTHFESVRCSAQTAATRLLHYLNTQPKQGLGRHLQSLLAHDTLVAVSLAVWTPGRVTFPSTEEFPVFHLASKLITYILKINGKDNQKCFFSYSIFWGAFVKLKVSIQMSGSHLTLLR